MKQGKAVPNNDVTPQLFKSKLIDKLARTHIAIPVSMFFLYAAGLIYYTKVATDLSNLQVVSLFFAGWLFFTFVEYMVHKYAYHAKLDANEQQKKISYIMHGAHHDYPKDKQRLALPPLLSVVIGTLLLLIFELVLDIYSFSVLAGFMTGYAFYLLVHYAVHIFRPPNNFLKALWSNHAIHHYYSESLMYGVSSPLWDYILGTYPRRNQKRDVEVKIEG
ncbi:MAG TPA: sterol desaturase family protein [Saprospiraceae bacterium]|nr:sterol desaturase family protein [Saprospiraceae bacterium]HMQ85889.1 sterol desaturase family protein [Saprospiraceae bacterium]